MRESKRERRTPRRRSGDSTLREKAKARARTPQPEVSLEAIRRREERRSRSRSTRLGPQWMQVNRMFARYALPRSQPIEKSTPHGRSRPRLGERMRRKRKPIQLSLPVWILVGAVAASILGGWAMSVLGWGLYTSQPALPWIRALGVGLLIFWLCSGIRPEPFEPPARRRDQDATHEPPRDEG